MNELKKDIEFWNKNINKLSLQERMQLAQLNLLLFIYDKLEEMNTTSTGIDTEDVSSILSSLSNIENTLHDIKYGRV